MKKRVIHLILILFSVAVLCFGSYTTVHAYTQEQIQQAKAWLSAHGYSPDEAGANQAYQDYLNGKFDEELGITTTEQTTTGTTEARSTGTRTTEHRTTEITTEKKTEQSGEEQRDESGQTENNQDLPEQSMGTGQSADAEKDAKVPVEDESGQESTVESEGQTISAGAGESKANEPQEVTLYKEENADSYREAGTVIALAVMLVLVVAGLWQLFLQSDKKERKD